MVEYCTRRIRSVKKIRLRRDRDMKRRIRRDKQEEKINKQ